MTAPTLSDERIDALSDAVAAQKRTQVIPPETCPLIDKAIKAVEKSEQLAAKVNKHADEKELRDTLWEIEYTLSGLTDTLEVIRTHNATLRQLGKDWAEIATDALRGTA